MNILIIYIVNLRSHVQDFKDIPSNKLYMEDSIAESYVVAESFRYCLEYMPNPLDGNHILEKPF